MKEYAYYDVNGQVQYSEELDDQLKLESCCFSISSDEEVGSQGLYIKTTNGSFFDPTQTHQRKSKMERTKFIHVRPNAFSNYVQFLKTKRNSLLLQAQREN